MIGRTAESASRRMPAWVAGLVPALLFCLWPALSGAAGTFRIGLTLGLTGKYASLSEMKLRGYKLWENDVNARGGILGKKVELIIHDDGSDPARARTIYKQFIEKDRVDFVFAPYSSEITEAILPVTEKNHYPLIASGASADSIWQKGYRYVFGLFSPASRLSVGFLELMSLSSITDIAVVNIDDPFSRNLSEGSKKWARRFGLKTVFSQEYDRASIDYEAIARQVRETGAQALIVCGHLEEAVNMRLAFRKIGWKPKIFFSPVGPGLPAFYTRLGQDAEGVFSSSQWELTGGLQMPGSREFHDAFLKAYGEAPSHFAATAYAAGQVLEAAVRKTKNTDRRRLRDAIALLDTLTVTGRYGVDRTGVQIKNFALVVQIQNGRSEVVWPVNLRKKEPVIK